MAEHQDPEIAALYTIVAALGALDEDTVKRVLAYLNDRYLRRA